MKQISIEIKTAMGTSFCISSSQIPKTEVDALTEDSKELSIDRYKVAIDSTTGALTLTDVLHTGAPNYNGFHRRGSGGREVND